jgi:hypothetical protein
MPKLSMETALRASDDVVFREVDGEAVILNLRSGIYFGLDTAGTRIWQLIEQHQQLSMVLMQLGLEYEAPEEELERDLLRLATDLTEKGLVIDAGATATAEGASL